MTHVAPLFSRLKLTTLFEEYRRPWIVTKPNSSALTQQPHSFIRPKGARTSNGLIVKTPRL